jgi:hypothetical protein
MKLIKQETGKKSGPKYIYSIVDENGNVLQTRKSNNEYVAATICGKYFFGRFDLIGKGEHGTRLNNIEKAIAKYLSLPGDEKSQNYSNFTNAEHLEDAKKQLKRFESIAKL